jgi:pimeloyl-ACP methyl ester carboxylesterase
MSTNGRFRYLETKPRATVRARGTLVLVHAFPLNARMWDRQVSPLGEQGWRVIAPQLRGFDGGQDPPARSMDDYAGDVIDLLDSLHIQEAVIGGLSLGGYVTLAILRHAPQYMRGLVLADTRAEADTPEGLEGRKRMLKLVAEQGPRAVADAMIPKLLAEETRRTRPDVVEHVRSLILASSAEAISGAVTAMMTRADSTPLLGSIHVPTLVLVGEHDEVTPPSVARGLHVAIAGSVLTVVSGAGHLSSLEQPDAFSAALLHFLDREL